MKKIKVLQIIPSFGVGGAEKVVLNYLKYNCSETMHIKAVSLYPKQNTIYDTEIENNNYDVVYLHKSRGLDFNVVHELKKLIEEYNPDVIHTHLYTLKYLALTGKIKNRTIFHTIHSRPDKDAGRIDVLVNKYFFKKGLVTPIALQNRLAVDVNQYYDINNTKVIRNGISIKDYTKKNASLAKKLGLSQNDFVIGHIGRFSAEKNHEFILNVFQQLLYIKENAVLLLIGTGSDEEKIKELGIKLKISNKIKFLGSRVDIPELLNIMDVFFFPSLYEGLGIVLVEAQAAGVPCLVSTAVPDEVLLTQKIEKIDLHTPTEMWIDKLVHPEKIYNEKIYEELTKYDISETLLELEKLYREKSNYE